MPVPSNITDKATAIVVESKRRFTGESLSWAVRGRVSPPGSIGISKFFGSGVASNADHRHCHQNDRGPNHREANVVSCGPFRNDLMVVSRRTRQWIYKQDLVPGKVKRECEHTDQNHKSQCARQPPSRGRNWSPVANK